MQVRLGGVAYQELQSVREGYQKAHDTVADIETAKEFVAHRGYSEKDALRMFMRLHPELKDIEDSSDLDYHRLKSGMELTRYRKLIDDLDKEIADTVGEISIYLSRLRRPEEHPHGNKFALLAIVFASVGAASWLWVWNGLQQQPTTSLAIAAFPTFNYVNILFSILILAGLAYGFKKLEK